MAITQLGLAHELLDRSRHPGDLGRIPVLYITVPPAATPRMIAAEFARFLGLPVTARFNITDIIEAVVGVCTDARTSLVLIDELHNISLTSRNGAEVADTPQVLLRAHSRGVRLRQHQRRAAPGQRPR
ncbi:AAA family ATPase [Streptomyces virginiae]|uniref:AAA family ATPase n=1 Tax=Streptomyces virginiae TaxID=1961 RepID=UPI0036A31199